MQPDDAAPLDALLSAAGLTPSNPRLAVTDTAYVERALIGALLNEPRSGPDLPMLAQRDFTDPLCRALWPVLSTQARLGAGSGDVAEMAERLTGRGCELHPNRRSTAAVAELQTHAPARPHPDAYARLIIDETLRREVVALGYLLTQIEPAQPEQAITTIDAITAQLQAHRTRSPLGPATPQAQPDSTPPPGDANDSATSRPGPNARAAGPRRYAVLRAAIHDHPGGSRAHVQACITVNDLTLPHIRASSIAVDQLQTRACPSTRSPSTGDSTIPRPRTHGDPPWQSSRDSREASVLHQGAVRTLTVASATRVLTPTPTTVTALHVNPPPPLVETIDTITKSARRPAATCRSDLLRTSQIEDHGPTRMRTRRRSSPTAGAAGGPGVGVAGSLSSAHSLLLNRRARGPFLGSSSYLPPPASPSTPPSCPPPPYLHPLSDPPPPPPLLPPPAPTRCLVVDHGRVVERGRHAELFAQGGLYAELCRTQFLEGASRFPSPTSGGERRGAAVPIVRMSTNAATAATHSGRRGPRPTRTARRAERRARPLSSVNRWPLAPARPVGSCADCRQGRRPAR